MRSTKLMWALAAVALMAAVSPASAQGVTEGNWIDLFDGETLYGWTQFGDAQWQVFDGKITCVNGWSGFLATTSRFADFELQIRAQVGGGGTFGVEVRGSLDGYSGETGASTLVLEPAEKPYEISIKAVGNAVTATVNGEAAEMPAASAGKGHVMLEFQRYNGKPAPALTIYEARLRPLNAKPIFDGKTLEGWNIIPDHQSVFKVVDGAINITNGNGQIETAGVYRDFVLQLEIFSNGDHLNSGVFFRGPVGVFWKGYESQVRNQWEESGRHHPVDYGTGGLYAIDPARKVVSSDGEWFEKTVIADGNHYAVWINGYQVSDFYDTRPVSENRDGKSGYVPQAGTIHLQGHDPTTDLSFKNINVGVYPEK